MSFHLMMFFRHTAISRILAPINNQPRTVHPLPDNAAKEKVFLLCFRKETRESSKKST
jgi:hypothetical protein